jgi:hypothetical protein
LVTTAARPTSEPVPDVVGSATTGAMTAAFARVHQSPTSSRSNTGMVWPCISAISLPASSAEPPPKATTPSWPPALNAATPAAMFDSTGFGCTSEKTFAATPAAASASSAFRVIGILATTGSVTNSGFENFAAFTASPISLARPAPKRTVVG